MKNILIILGICAVVSGCAGKGWYSQQKAELEEAYNSGQLTYKEYKELQYQLKTAVRSGNTSGHVWVHKGSTY